MGVRDLMHPGLITCRPDTRLGDAAALLATHRIHALIVAETGSRPLGVLSDTDLPAGEWSSDDENVPVSYLRGFLISPMQATP